MLTVSDGCRNTRRGVVVLEDDLCVGVHVCVRVCLCVSVCASSDVFHGTAGGTAIL